MGNRFYKIFLSVFLFFFVDSEQAMLADRQACCICSEQTRLIVHPYVCAASKGFPEGHGMCEECWQTCVFEHKYGGQLPLQCPQCRAQVKVAYKLCYVDGCLPARPVHTINEAITYDKDTVLDGNVLGYDICFGKHGSLQVKGGCVLFFKNIRLKNVRRRCIGGYCRAARVELFLQNVEIMREDDYFFPDAHVYPGFLRLNDVLLIWFKHPREFTDRHLRDTIRGLSQTPSEIEAAKQ